MNGIDKHFSQGVRGDIVERIYTYAGNETSLLMCSSHDTTCALTEGCVGWQITQQTHIHLSGNIPEKNVNNSNTTRSERPIVSLWMKTRFQYLSTFQIEHTVHHLSNRLHLIKYLDSKQGSKNKILYKICSITWWGRSEWKDWLVQKEVLRQQRGYKD